MKKNIIFLVEESDENTRLMSVILGGLAVFLLMVIIGLVVKIMKFQTGTCESYCIFLYLVLLYLYFLFTVM